ncbi:MAG: helix-turn-helix domain-containing protein [Firmicutes bacterium]|nr:helix-turn-helix domain-containing protein [[Eubacterium] siraeum]MCM1486891.1 helix-turn-helix domain-containing protein [Bacillota bacterium]
MEKSTIGQKISAFRKEKGLTQEVLAEKLGVSSQAVSKWENDISCPDIMLLPRIAELFNVTTDEILGCGREERTVELVPEDSRKDPKDLVMRIIVDSADGDRVRINLPMALIKMGREMGISAPQLTGSSSLQGIDFDKIAEMAENGLLGELVEVESADGDNVKIVVEEI